MRNRAASPIISDRDQREVAVTRGGRSLKLWENGDWLARRKRSFCAGATNAFDGERRASRFLRDCPILRDDEPARGFVFIRAAQQIGRHAPVGSLRTILIDHVEEHEFVLGVGARFLRHDVVLYANKQTPALARWRHFRNEA